MKVVRPATVWGERGDVVPGIIDQSNIHPLCRTAYSGVEEKQPILVKTHVGRDVSVIEKAFSNRFFVTTGT